MGAAATQQGASRGGSRARRPGSTAAGAAAAAAVPACSGTCVGKRPACAAEACMTAGLLLHRGGHTRNKCARRSLVCGRVHAGTVGLFVQPPPPRAPFCWRVHMPVMVPGALTGPPLRHSLRIAKGANRVHSGSQPGVRSLSLASAAGSGPERCSGAPCRTGRAACNLGGAEWQRTPLPAPNHAKQQATGALLMVGLHYRQLG